MKKLITLIIGCTICLLVAAQPEPSNNVGIGTNNPTRARLEVNGAVDATTAIFGGEGNGISIQRNWPAIGFNSYWYGGNRALDYGFGAKISLDPNYGDMYFDVLPFRTPGNLEGSGTRALTISSFGNVGIGTVTPNAPLQFANTLANKKIVLWESADNDHQIFGFGIESGTMRYSVAATNNVHRFYAGTSQGASSLLMSIWGDRTVTIGDDSGGGKLGINLSSPQYTLHIKQAGGTGLCIQESTFNTTWQFQATSFTGGTSNHLNLKHQGGTVGQFHMSGEYTWNSDVRLKTNVQDMPGLLNKVMQLRPVFYEMKKNNPEHRQTLGFIAQEVKPLFPELVFINENPDGKKEGLENLHSLNYSGFGVIAIKAIQEQQQQIDELKKEINELKQLIRSKL